MAGHLEQKLSTAMDSASFLLEKMEDEVILRLCSYPGPVTDEHRSYVWNMLVESFMEGTEQ